jgi:hypothetical protein
VSPVKYKLGFHIPEDGILCGSAEAIEGLHWADVPQIAVVSRRLQPHALFVEEHLRTANMPRTNDVTEHSSLCTDT